MEEKRISMFVLTGGPCGGKSTIQKHLAEASISAGYIPIFLPEMATKVMASGIKPDEQILSTLDFQRLILRQQLGQENDYQLLLKATKNTDKKILIFLDRGINDAKSYVSDSLWKQILASENLTEQDVFRRYDMVLHLVTTAYGAEQYYTLANNPERYENTIEKARMAEDANRKVYIGHPSVKYFDNSTDFPGKIERVLDAVFSFLGKPYPLENQSRFIIQKPSVDILKELDASYRDISQIYLRSDDPKKERRVRVSGIDGNYDYLYTEKTQILVDEKKETMTQSRYCSAIEYALLLGEQDNSRHIITKRRWYFCYDNLYFELDEYPDWEHFAILEVHLSNKNDRIKIPEQFDVLFDISDNVKFKNYEMAKAFPSETAILESLG